MTMPKALEGRLRLPAIVAPMFLASGPDLVVEVCRAGLVGAFPALNPRSSAGYAQWLEDIAARLAETPTAAPYGVNLIVHKSKPRLAADLKLTVEHKAPLVITSLGAVRDSSTPFTPAADWFSMTSSTGGTPKSPRRPASTVSSPFARAPAGTPASSARSLS